MTVTYSFGCGKVLYATFHGMDSGASAVIGPHGYVLLYLILEVGVCDGTHV